MQQKHSLLFYGSLILLECLIWGIGNPLLKIGLEAVTPFYCLAWRYAIALLLFLLVFGKQIFQGFQWKFFWPCFWISFFTALAFGASVISLMYTTATNAGFLMSLSVLFTPFFSYIVLRSQIEKKHFLPITLVVIGLYFLCGGGKTFDFGMGESLALAASAAAACMLVFSSKYLNAIDPMVISTAQAGFSAIFFLLLALLFEPFPGLNGIPLLGWGVILYLAVGCTCLAYMFQNTALRHVPSMYVALMFCSEPVFTAAASYFMLNERLSVLGWIGAAFILAGMIAASLFPSNPETT